VLVLYEEISGTGKSVMLAPGHRSFAGASLPVALQAL
jgi:hypothetical protein